MNRSRYTPRDTAEGSGEYRHGDSNPGTNPASRQFFARVTAPAGGEQTICVSVERLGGGAMYRLVLEDGSYWLVDGVELRRAL